MFNKGYVFLLDLNETFFEWSKKLCDDDEVTKEHIRLSYIITNVSFQFFYLLHFS